MTCAAGVAANAPVRPADMVRGARTSAFRVAGSASPAVAVDRARATSRGALGCGRSARPGSGVPHLRAALAGRLSRWRGACCHADGSQGSCRAVAPGAARCGPPTAQRPDQERGQIQGGLVGPVQVLDDEHHRPGRAQPPEQAQHQLQQLPGLEALAERRIAPAGLRRCGQPSLPAIVVRASIRLPRSPRVSQR